MTGVSINLSEYEKEVVYLNQPPYLPGFYYVVLRMPYGPYSKHEDAEHHLNEWLRMNPTSKEIECVEF